MKRRGFLGVVGSGCLLWLRGVAEAMCNPSLVELFHHGRHLVQARGNGGKAPSLGSYFVNWFGHSSFLIQSGSHTKVVADPNFNVTPGTQAGPASRTSPSSIFRVNGMPVGGLLPIPFSSTRWGACVSRIWAILAIF